MARFMKYGIDLGTTNSSIAVLNGTEAEVIKNNDSQEITPSAVWIDRNGRIVVGLQAKNQVELDPGNAFCEFKRGMGTDREYLFTKSQRRMRPEELSAEVLKSLKASVQQRKSEELREAVITVPAAFELPQCEATRCAAQLAGITFSPLLQEPIAAALAYGFQSESDKVFWLVYDLGGGTFDAAVIQLRGGTIQVVNHGGDNHLGGKNIDDVIVNQLLVPAVIREYHLTDFERGNPKWKVAFAKLKMAAETAKIQVSNDEEAAITIDNLFQDGNGEPVQFEYDLKREEVERLAEPLFRRSIKICQKVLAEKKLAFGHLEKVLLVGGPTLTPRLKELLADCIADPSEGMGARLDFSEDPLTVVARGAAIFAGMQRTEETISVPVAAGQYAIELEHQPNGL